MTRHLSSDELVTCLDGGRDANLSSHLQRCESCQAALREMTAILDAARRASDVPEPAPPFWDDFSRRIQARTSKLPATRSTRVWTARALWIPVAGVAAMFVVAILSKPWWPLGSEGPREPVAAAGEVEVTWEVVGDMASTLSTDDVRLVVGSSPESTVGDLTPSERDAFVRLLGAELGRAE